GAGGGGRGGGGGWGGGPRGAEGAGAGGGGGRPPAAPAGHRAEGKEAMVFQARKWGWKRIAAQLLLIPVLGGASAAVAHAQARTGGAPAGQSSATAAPVMNQAPPGRGNDPKQLLKDGRKALAASRVNDAQDLAQAAAANNQSGKWGLFDDTPNALLKDIQAARQKAEKAEAEQLLKDAKALLHKSAANDGERAYNLDEALKKVRKADQLHGPHAV